MADTYFGYAERNASDEINWAKIGKDLTDMLKDETKIREDKKAAIDESTRKYGQTLSNGPQGEDQGVNKWWLTFADNAQKAMLLQESLLKSGQLKPKDYFVMRQNLVDGTNEATSLVKDYQEEYKNKMDRWKNKISAKKEQRLMAQAEGYGNFNESELYINPTNFAVNVAKKEKQIVDGKEVYVMSNNPNNFTTVNAMRNRIKGTFDRFDVIENLKPGVAVLGKDVNTLIEAIGTTKAGGYLKSVKDITQRPDFGVEANNAISLFERAENNYIKSLMVNPDDAASVLTDYVMFDPKTKEEYDITWDEKEAGGHLILQKNDSSGRPISVLSKDQEAEVEKALRAQFRTMLDREIELKATPQAQLQEYRPRSAAEMDRADAKATAKNVAQNLVYSLTGNANESAAGTKYLSSSTGLPFTKTKEGYTVVDENGNEQTFKFKADGTTLADPTKFTKSFIGTISRKMGIREDDVIKEFGNLLPKGAKINLTTVAKGFEEQENKPINVEAVITPDLFTSKSALSTQKLQGIIPKGFTVTDMGGALFNDVKVTAPNGKVYNYNANVSKTEAEQAQKSLAQFIKLNSVTSSPAAAATNTTVTGGTTR